MHRIISLDLCLLEQLEQAEVVFCLCILNGHLVKAPGVQEGGQLHVEGFVRLAPKVNPSIKDFVISS